MARLPSVERWAIAPCPHALQPLLVSHLLLFHWPKQITWPRFRKWRNRCHFCMREAARSRGTEARTQREESVAVLQATDAVRGNDASRTTLVTHLSHLPPRCSELPWHHEEQRDLRPSYETYVGSDKRGSHVPGWFSALASLPCHIDIFNLPELLPPHLS